MQDQLEDITLECGCQFIDGRFYPCFNALILTQIKSELRDPQSIEIIEEMIAEHYRLQKLPEEARQ